MDDCFCILLSQHKTVTENNERNLLSTEAAARGVLSEKLFLNILQYSQESTVVGVSFSESCRPEPCNFIKKKLQHRCFSVNIAEFLRTPILKNICERLLLSIPISGQCAHDLQKAFCCFQVVWNGNIGQKWVNPF